MPQRPLVRLPRSNASRSAPAYLKLLYRVLPRATLPAAVFQGRVLKAGSTIPERDLWPAPDYPSVPVLLEYAGPAGGRRRPSRYLYVLWRYESGEFRELARATAESTEWVEDLKQAAKRAMVGPLPFPVADTHAAAERVLQALDHELAPLERGEQAEALSWLYEQFTARMAEATG